MFPIGLCLGYEITGLYFSAKFQQEWGVNMSLTSWVSILQIIKEKS